MDVISVYPYFKGLGCFNKHMLKWDLWMTIAVFYLLCILLISVSVVAQCQAHSDTQK